MFFSETFTLPFKAQSLAVSWDTCKIASWCNRQVLDPAFQNRDYHLACKHISQIFEIMAQNVASNYRVTDKSNTDDNQDALYYHLIRFLIFKH